MVIALIIPVEANLLFILYMWAVLHLSLMKRVNKLVWSNDIHRAVNQKHSFLDCLLMIYRKELSWTHGSTNIIPTVNYLCQKMTQNGAL